MHIRPNYPSAFESTDPHVLTALSNMPAVNVTMLTLLHIDPSLSRQRERDRLRTLVKLTCANPSNAIIGTVYQGLRAMHGRGFPVPAFGDSSLRLLPEDDARQLLTQLRADLGTRWPSDALERPHIERLMQLLGYEDSCASQPDAGAAP
jgi:hypothetical protein